MKVELRISLIHRLIDRLKGGEDDPPNDPAFEN